MSASIICDCGHKCTTKGVRTTTYTMWVRDNRYARTCPRCEARRKDALLADGFTLFNVYPTP